MAPSPTGSPPANSYCSTRQQILFLTEPMVRYEVKLPDSESGGLFGDGPYIFRRIGESRYDRNTDDRRRARFDEPL